jgi:hypothetical protein
MERHIGHYIVGVGCGCASGVVLAIVILIALICHHGIGC